MDKIETCGQPQHQDPHPQKNAGIAFALIGGSTLLLLTCLVMANGYEIKLKGSIPTLSMDFRFTLSKPSHCTAS